VSVTLLVAAERLDEESIALGPDAYRHLVRARRLTVGDRVRVVDGAGRARYATVVSISRSSAELAVGAEAESNEPAAAVELFVAPPRPQRASWLVEKATEIGVIAVRFFGCERAPRSYGEATLERLRRVAAAAVEQSQRSRLPEVTGIHSWEELPRRLAGHDRRWLLAPGAPPASLTPRAGGSSALVVGPEGGFTAAEIERLEGAGCATVGLGPTTLRTETAAVAAACGALFGSVTGSVDSPEGGR
jgi:16S rRNA (uracil1498-N3)-methyltransferase